jgi:hypothetical protein
LPGLATSVQASQDYDDDDDNDDDDGDDDDDGGNDDFDIFLKPIRHPNNCIVNAMGLGDFDIFLIPYKKPFNECVVNSI